MTSSGEELLQVGVSIPSGGLTEREVDDRRAIGMGNQSRTPTSRSYRQIFFENVFTFINLLLFGLGLALALLGRVGDALISTAVILLNVVVSVVQEIRAKRTLDKIALLARPTATVVREGQERMVAPDELVVDDVVKVGPGDQIQVDGRVLVSNHMAMDESPLTGEADQVAKRANDHVYSGSFCATGEGYYVAEEVGARSLAAQMTASARAFRRVLTPLQQQINLVVRLALLIVLYMEFLLLVTSLLKQINLADSVENSTIVAGLVPNGLFLSIAVAYALGAVRILRFGALVQQANAIESLSHVDVICFDKTGTLTTNSMHVAGIYSIAAPESEAIRVLGAMAASASGGNKTTEAIRSKWPSLAVPVAGEVPFSSVRKWSAVAFADGSQGASELPFPSGTYVLGAPEMLQLALQTDAADVRAIESQVRTLAAQGLRVLLLAHAPHEATLEDRGDDSRLPTELQPWALVALGDELRPEAREALHAFIDAGVHPKVISGDNPETVTALARQAGFAEPFQVVSGPELEKLDPAAFEATAESASIFGRITPKQKERLVQALRQRGHYVAMIGDGVNDVLSLKQANVGIAMRSGSAAARGVADVVLMQDSFAVLVPAVREGQRIVNGMQSILKLFLTRIGTVGLVIFSSLVIGTFPLELRQGSLVTLFSVGIPAIALALWAHPGVTPPNTLMRTLLHFVVPPVVLSTTIGLLLFIGSYVLSLLQSGGFGARNPALLSSVYPEAQSLLAAFLVVCGLLLVLFVAPPSRWWEGGHVVTTRDRRPAWLTLGLLGAFLLITLVPPLRTLFALSALGAREYLLLAIATGVWLVAVRTTWRSRLLTRYLGMN